MHNVWYRFFVGTILAMFGDGMLGKWIFVPLEAWESKPKRYYCLRRSQIYLQLVFKVNDRDLRFCMRHCLLPPERLRRKQAQLWVAGARAAISRADVASSRAMNEAYASARRGDVSEHHEVAACEAA